MNDRLFPPRGAVPAPLALRTLWLAGACSLAVAALFWLPLLTGAALSGNDWSSHHYHYFDWVRLALRQFAALPLYMPDAVMTPNFLANAESPLLSPLIPLLLVLETDAYLKLLIVLYTALGLAGMFVLLRDLEVPAPVAALCALAFALGGFLPAHLSVGHPWALGSQVLPALLCLYRRAALGSFRALWLAAALGASVIVGGQHQPFIWQGLFLAGFAALWAARARASFPLVRLLWLFTAMAGLAAPKLLPMLAEFADYAPTARIQGLPLGLLVTTLTARGQQPGFAASGVAFTHGAGWWEYAFYIGPFALLCMLVGIAAARSGRSLLLLGLLFLWLSLAPIAGLDPWALLRELPVWRTQRAPSRFLEISLFAFGVVAALGLGRLYEQAARRSQRFALAGALALALLVAVDLHVESRAWQRAAQGAGIPARDHRPQPVAFGSPAGTRVELVEFSPNRLVYRVQAHAAAQIVLPLRWGRRSPEWQLTGGIASNRFGRLGVEVPPGESRIELRYRPAFASAGLAVFAATLLAFIGQLVLRRRRHGD
jgi:hypothetical protein